MDDIHSIKEKNARASARGRYFTWLSRRFGRLDLLEMADEPDPLSLRKIFTPLRADEKDMDEETMAGPEKVDKEELSGKDVYDLLAERPFLSLSGRPGSGKTTLVHSVVLELCGDRPSSLRKKLAGEKGIAPIPLILRNYLDRLEETRSLDQLLDLFWQEAAIQAKDDDLPLDIERLKISFRGDGDAYPCLLLFDGIDEVGGPEIRNRVLDMAWIAYKKEKYRVLVTGRPGGFEKLHSSQYFVRAIHFVGHGKALKESVVAGNTFLLVHLLPFAWEQIDYFIREWYKLRNDWKRKREKGVRQFLESLRDKNRDYLLALARRPIFLTLMALVHCTRNEMPHGRPALYQSIIDLYLVRQERHRNLRQTIDGDPMPHWPDQEKRMVLGYLAWRSQIKRGEDKGGAQGESEKREKRQVVWKDGEMRDEIAEQLRSGNHGRFSVLKPQDADGLMNYFLHPAGLLAKPAPGRIQFAHLSFQEYLCAEFLYGRARVKGLRSYLEKELFSRLSLPGWKEVGILLLAIHAEQTQNEGHFQILTWLNPSDVDQADLLVQALTGKELPFDEQERLSWLPIAMGAALIHPEAEFVTLLSKLSEPIREHGLSVVTSLFDAASDDERWNILCEKTAKNPPIGMDDDMQEYFLFHDMRDRWNFPENDASWSAGFGPEEARANSLLSFLIQSDWSMKKEGSEKSAASVLEGNTDLIRSMASWIRKHVSAKKQETIFLVRKKINEGIVPVLTQAGSYMDMVIPSKGPLFTAFAERIPLDLCILAGEYQTFSTAQLYVLNPFEKLPPRAIFAAQNYQVYMLLEIAEYSNALVRFSENKRSLYRSLSRSLSLHLPLSLRRSLRRSLFRSLFRSLPLSRSLSRSRLLSVKLSSNLFTSKTLKDKVLKIEKLLGSKDPGSTKHERNFDKMLSRFRSRHAARDWFLEQSEDIGLATRRGLRIGEPLPKELGLFDEKGIPHEIQKRENWVRLREWIDDQDAVFRFFFPDGLPAEEYEFLKSDLELLYKQPWSPQKGLDAALEDWPEDEPERDLSVETAEARLEKACDEFLKRIEKY